MIPQYSIDFYAAVGGAARPTIHLIDLYTKKVLTESLGSFVAMVKNDSNLAQISQYDEVRIKLGMDTLPADYTFRGRVTKIKSSVADKKIKIISGLDRGEVLLRRLKSKYYLSTGVSAIVHEFADDLGLGDADIVADAQTIELGLAETSYFEAMQQLSDYWVNAGTQVKKDFYVDEDGHLNYKNRSPAWRTAGVAELTLGENLLSYDVDEGLDNVKNQIRAYGGWDDKYTTDMPGDENWTEGPSCDAHWVVEKGSVAVDAVNFHVGTYSIQATPAFDGVDWHADFYRTFEPEFGTISGNPRSILQSFSRIACHAMCNIAGPITMRLYLYAPDTSNYFWIASGPTYSGVWDPPLTQAMGPTAGWTEVGSPRWDFITALKFYSNNAIAYTLNIDGLALQGGRFRAEVSDPTSQTAYQRRDLVHIDDKLLSNAYCATRANTLLYQLKDPVKEVQLLCRGNSNILLGDQIPLTLPNEGITAENFFVVGVENFLNTENKGFHTKPTLLNTASSREKVSWDTQRELSILKQRVNRLSNYVHTIR